MPIAERDSCLPDVEGLGAEGVFEDECVFGELDSAAAEVGLAAEEVAELGEAAAAALEPHRRLLLSLTLRPSTTSRPLALLFFLLDFAFHFHTHLSSFISWHGAIMVIKIKF